MTLQEFTNLKPGKDWIRRNGIRAFRLYLVKYTGHDYTVNANGHLVRHEIIVASPEYNMKRTYTFGIEDVVIAKRAVVVECPNCGSECNTHELFGTVLEYNVRKCESCGHVITESEWKTIKKR